MPERDEPYSAEDLVSASELHDFVLRERAWFLARQGHPVSSAEARERREAGTTFHVERAEAARRGNNAYALWWAIILVIAALAVGC